MMSWGFMPSTVQPTDCAVPKISLTVPDSSRDMDRSLMMRAILTISSKFTFPLCLMFLTFLRSRGGSLRPFHSCVALAMSSPTFFGDKPRVPTLGASEDVAPTSPPTALRQTILISVGSNLGGILLDVWSPKRKVFDGESVG